MNSWHPALLNPAQERIMMSQEGRAYRIQIAVLGKNHAQPYAILYLLDGDIMMPLALSMTQMMLQTPQQRRTGEGRGNVILVAIGYPNTSTINLEQRTFDYTPAVDNAKHYGGAEAFSRFLDETLTPTIAGQYPINTQSRALFGHSFGGLFALYRLFNHTAKTDHYLISSPSIWWHEQHILKDEPKLRQAPQHIRLSVGTYEQYAQQPQRQHTLQQRAMIDRAESLYHRLQQRFPNAALTLQHYPHATHTSVIPQALYDGIAHWLAAIYPQDN